jgi:hypothetical protein
MVDYRKWDAMDYGDSDKEEDNRKKKPTVTTINRDKGSKVTIGPGGYHIHDKDDDDEEEEQSKLPSFSEVHQTILENERKRGEFAADQEEEEFYDDTMEDNDVDEQEYYELQRQLQEQKQRHEEIIRQQERASLPTVLEESAQLQSTETQSKPVTLKTRRRNGGEGVYRGIPYEWSQTKTEVNLFFYLSPEELQNKLIGKYSETISNFSNLKKKDFQVNYEESSRKLLISYRHLNTSTKQMEFLPILEGNFPFDIEITGEIDNPYDDLIDWNLSTTSAKKIQFPSIFSFPSSPVDDGKIFIEIELLMKKKLKFANAIIWWKNVFVGEPEIDLTTIADRAKNYSEFMTNFAIAQEKFREKIQQREKVEI